MIYHNATVLTGDAQCPRASAFAVEEGRFTAIGPAAQLFSLLPAAPRVDLQGRTVIPGLIDAHGHLLPLGMRKIILLDISNCSPQQVAERVAEKAAELPENQWIWGFGWDQNNWQPAELPTHHLLTEAAPRHAVFLRRIDGHAAWVNQHALALCGIDTATPDPQGGKILRDARGLPSGVLIDKAIELVDIHKPPLTYAEKQRAVLWALQHLAGMGLTMVHDAMLDYDTWCILKELADNGQLPIRVYGFAVWQSPDFHKLTCNGPCRHPSQRLWLKGVKIFADGALGSHGAALLAPYTDAPENHGLFLTSPEQMHKAVNFCRTHGFQPATHAIGDRAVRTICDIYLDMSEQCRSELRPRIEHAQIMHPDDVNRLVDAHIVVSMQPIHCTSDYQWVGERIGSRTTFAYAWRSLLNTGAVLAFGSDFPVEPANPLWGIHAALTRQDRATQPQGGWHAEQCLSLDEALQAYTCGGAYAAFQERQLGSISAGKLADFTILSENPYEVPPEALWKIRALPIPT